MQNTIFKTKIGKQHFCQVFSKVFMKCFLLNFSNVFSDVLLSCGVDCCECGTKREHGASLSYCTLPASKYHQLCICKYHLRQKQIRQSHFACFHDSRFCICDSSFRISCFQYFVFFVVNGQQFLFSVFYTSEPSSAILNEYCGRDHGWGRGGKIVADHLHNTYHTPPAYNSTDAFTIPTITTIFTAQSIHIKAATIITIITEICYV